MSEFSNTKQKRIDKLLEVSHLLLKTGNARPFILENKDFIPTVIPSDFISLFDELVKSGISIEDLKTLSNKVLNIFHTPINDYKRVEPKADSFLFVLEQNNEEMEKLLNEISPVFKAFTKNEDDEKLKKQLINLFTQLEVFSKHYTIKENILFPIIEQTWPDYRCLQIMWSFHDDIRANIKQILDYLNNGNDDNKAFYRCIGDVFFNMLTIKFREEHILFPLILTTVKEDKLQEMNREAVEMGYPYIKPTIELNNEEELQHIDGKVNLGTGLVDAKQLQLIFNHLPVDITFVDENDVVQYFSTPKKRIFPRTKAIIGREVKNCHPPESVHIVEKIVEEFKKGTKHQADFWIKMKGEFILIQYFALRDEKGNYKGVIEVSQEVSEIRALEGENRLLDW